MEGNDFVAEDIVSGGDVGWNRDGPRVIVGDKLIRGPCTWDSCIINESNTINLEEFKCSLVDSLAITTTISKVIDNWAVVRGWPSGPL